MFFRSCRFVPEQSPVFVPRVCIMVLSYTPSTSIDYGVIVHTIHQVNKASCCPVFPVFLFLPFFRFFLLPRYFCPPLFSIYFFLFCFPFGCPWGPLGDDIGMDTAVEDTVQGQTRGSFAPNPPSLGSASRRHLGGVICLIMGVSFFM